MTLLVLLFIWLTHKLTGGWYEWTPNLVIMAVMLDFIIVMALILIWMAYGHNSIFYK